MSKDRALRPLRRVFGFTAERSWCRRPRGPAVPCDSPTAVPRAWTRRFVRQQGPQFASTGGFFSSRAATRVVTKPPSCRQARGYPERGCFRVEAWCGSNKPALFLTGREDSAERSVRAEGQSQPAHRWRQYSPNRDVARWAVGTLAERSLPRSRVRSFSILFLLRPPGTLTGPRALR
jgi:hypothetical protein